METDKKNLRVLIADSSAMLRAKIAEWIGEIEGAEVAGEAQTAHGATAAIAKLKPDVAILDLLAAEGTALDVLAKIGRKPRGLTVIILTDFPYRILRDRCLALGADHFFDKANDFEKAVDVVERLAKKHRGKSKRERAQ